MVVARILHLPIDFLKTNLHARKLWRIDKVLLGHGKFEGTIAKGRLAAEVGHVAGEAHGPGAGG